MRYFIIIFIFILSACSPIKRHSRLVKKFPYVHTIDSVQLIDTVRLFTTAVEVDTVVEYLSLRDGVTIKKDNLTVEIIRVHDSVYINGSCDTIYLDSIVERMIPVKYYENVENKENKFISYFLAFMVVILLIILLKKK